MTHVNVDGKVISLNIGEEVRVGLKKGWSPKRIQVELACQYRLAISGAYLKHVVDKASGNTKEDKQKARIEELEGMLAKAKK